jgi:hypothetical protein
MYAFASLVSIGNYLPNGAPEYRLSLLWASGRTLPQDPHQVELPVHVPMSPPVLG